jgi:DNA-binding transcriptional ArsR family regulator
MRIDLQEPNVQPILAALAEEKDGLQGLLDAIAAEREWQPEYDERLDSVYRTRLRHLFAPRQDIETLAEFGRHLNIATSMVRTRSPGLAAKLACYEAVIVDALDEMESDWVSEVLKKKHVSEILAILAARHWEELGAAELLSLSGLERANLSRKLGLMESAGLIARRYDGSHLRVRISELGGRLFSGSAAVDPTVVRFGNGEGGLFLERRDGRAVMITKVNGRAVITQHYGSEASRLNPDEVEHVGFIPNGEPGSFDVYVSLNHAAPPRRHVLGTWRGARGYQHLSEWVRDANALLGLRPVHSIPSADILPRVLQNGTLKYVPGKSLSLITDGEMKPYRAKWAHRIPMRICELLHQVYRKPITAQEVDWPKKWTWEAVFDGTLSPQLYGTDFNCDFGLEILYLDMARVGRYDIVPLGTIPTFTLLAAAENHRLDSMLAFIRSQDSKNRAASLSGLQAKFGSATDVPSCSFSNFKVALKEVGLVTADDQSGLGSRWKLYTTKSTVAANVMRDLISHGDLEDDDVLELPMAWECADKLKSERHTAVVVCDNVIAEHVLRVYPRGRDALKAIRIDYPQAVPFGFGVPLDEFEWKSIVHKAVYDVLLSEEFAPSWRQTCASLANIDARVDVDFIPAATKGEEYHGVIS